LEKPRAKNEIKLNLDYVSCRRITCIVGGGGKAQHYSLFSSTASTSADRSVPVIYGPRVASAP
jgi:hypothetical protein